ncbi:MAG: exopolysaccharide biosynthesis polyprenyl glycosylphosphotransferase, partial [Fusobacterium sp.]
MILEDRVKNGYMFLLFILYQMSYSFFNIKLNVRGYVLFLALLFLYYLFDILNFKDRNFETRDFIYSFIINTVIFGINFSMKLNYKIILAVIAFSTFQILFRRALVKNRLNVVRVLVIDNGNHLEKIVKVLNKNLKYSYIGYVSDEKFEECDYLGEISKIDEIVKRKKINGVVFTNKKQIKNHSDLIVKLKLEGVRVIDYINFLELVEGKVDADEINSMWVLFTSGFETFSNIFQKRIKRMFDLVVSSVFLILAFPFMLVTFFLVKLDGGPAFFKQKRIGYLGKEFEIIKFRSMKVHDPEKFSKYASEDDDRIGKIGRFIRKTRLDEIPQLINVFRGEMSFVGPRPEWNELGHNYEEKIKNYELRYTVRPGITGWAQTMYFYSSNLEEVKNKLEYDLFYVKHQNL